MASLFYIVSLRVARATQGDPPKKKVRKKNKKTVYVCVWYVPVALSTLFYSI